MNLMRKARWLWAGVVAGGLGGFALGATEPPTNPQRTGGERDLPAPAPSLLKSEVAPIDLASTLRLAGVSNPEILLARERVDEAVALRQLAAAQFLPTINAGANFDTHTGPLQRSTGEIIKENRGALYAGLGAFAVGAGTVNIPGVVWNGNVAETIYRTLVSRQVVRQREFASDAVRNDVLLRVARAYLDLLRAEGQRAIAQQAREETREVARVTANFAQTGKGRQADADRAATELELRESEYLRAEESVLTSSARLCQLLNLDPATRLHATDGWVVPTPLVPNPVPLPELLAIALTQRPELRERQAAIRAALLYLDGTKVLPFSPNVILGYSAGTFGGGSNLVAQGIPQANGTVLQQPRFDSFAGREDFDAVVFWSLRNLGVGNVALVRSAKSNLRSEELRQVEILDRVRTEVAVAYTRTHTRFAQIDHGERGVQAAADAFREDLDRTRNVVGLPIEVLDSLRLLRLSRNLYLDAIIDYNLAQFELYVALGQPPAASLARAIPAKLVPAPEPTAPTASTPK
jgi:outer membrane protein TolC